VTLANPKVLGLLAQRDSISGIVRPFACAETYAVCAIGVPDVNIAIDSFTGDLSPNVSTCGTNNDCNCVESCLNGGGNLSSYDWSSGNSSIASLTSNPSYSFGDYEGMGPGSTVSAVTAVDNLMCQVSGGRQVTVNPLVQIQSVSVTPATINNTASPTQAIVTVQIYHTPMGSLTNPTVTISMGTASASPSTNTVTYMADTPEPISVSGTSPAVAKFYVNSTHQTTDGTVTIRADITSATSGITVKDPSPSSNG